MRIVLYLLPYYILFKRAFHLTLIIIFQLFIQLPIRLRIHIFLPHLLLEAPTFWDILYSHIEEYWEPFPNIDNLGEEFSDNDKLLSETESYN